MLLCLVAMCEGLENPFGQEAYAYSHNTTSTGSPPHSEGEQQRLWAHQLEQAFSAHGVHATILVLILYIFQGVAKWLYMIAGNSMEISFQHHDAMVQERAERNTWLCITTATNLLLAFLIAICIISVNFGPHQPRCQHQDHSSHAMAPPRAARDTLQLSFLYARLKENDDFLQQEHLKTKSAQLVLQQIKCGASSDTASSYDGLHPDVAEHIFNELDKNKNGVVSLYEFRAIVGLLYHIPDIVCYEFTA